MASITFSGQLDQAMNELAAEGNKVLFVPHQNVGEVLAGAASELVVDSDGSYSITLAYNTYSIYHYSDVTKRKTLIATDVVVSADTLVSTIPDLIGSTVPVTDESVLIIQGYLTDASNFASSAESSAASAANSASIAQSAATAATTSGAIYSSISDGLAATSDGEYFSVISSSDSGYIDLYINDNGASVYQKTYPSDEKVTEIESTSNSAYLSSRVVNIPRSKQGSDVKFSTSFAGYSGHFGVIRNLPRIEDLDFTTLVLSGNSILMSYVDEMSNYTELSETVTNTKSSVDTLKEQAIVEKNIPRAKSGEQGKISLYFDEYKFEVSSFRNVPRGEGMSFKSAMIVGNSVFMSDNEYETSQDEEDSFPTMNFNKYNIEPSAIFYTDTSSGESQIYSYEGSDVTQITLDGYDWYAPTKSQSGILKAIRSNGTNKVPYVVYNSGNALPINNSVYHKVSTGQSLALGSRGFVITGDPNDYDIGGSGRYGVLFTESLPASMGEYCLTLEGGPQPTSSTGNTTFEAMRETIRGVSGESISSSWAVGMRELDLKSIGADCRYLVSISALGGSPYSLLGKGTDVYDDAIACVTNSKSIADSEGWDYIVGSVSVTHGESQTDTTTSEYVAILNEWITDYQTDITAITGQSEPPVMFISQANTGEAGTQPAIPQAQLEAANTYDDIILTGPKYQHPYFDTYHMLAEGYVKTGELEAKAETFHLRGMKWQPLKPVSVSYTDNVITVELNNDVAGNYDTPGPIGYLVVDTDTVSDPGNYGFEIDTVNINSVEVGDSTITITCDADITSGTIMTYACQESGYSQPSNGRRGNVRDGDDRTVSRYNGDIVYNWLVAFEYEF